MMCVVVGLKDKPDKAPFRDLSRKGFESFTQENF
jgi:hypothetical protein